MVKAIAVILVVLSLILLVGGNIVSNALTDFTNKRLDSSEATLLNEVDARIYRDFHLHTPPQEIEISPDGIKYMSSGSIVRAINNGDSIEMHLEYPDGTSWSGRFKGNIEVKEVEVLNINDEYKVELANTTSRVLAITYKINQDFQKKRVSMNRDFTRYLIISR